MLDYDALETLEGLTKMAVCMTKALLKLMLFKTLSHKQLHLKHSPILTTRKTKQKKKQFNFKPQRNHGALLSSFPSCFVLDC